jgi:hypothetical protein
MPNGGSDCCGTCWFNATNRGNAGYHHGDPSISPTCTIRNLPIANPFYTYCANHPHRSLTRDAIPIGPVWVADSTDTRQIATLSPDTEEVRRHLLALLKDIREVPASEYPIGAYRDEVVVWQLGEFREERAVPDLERLARFNPHAAEPGPFGRNRQGLVALARKALADIQGPAA